MAKDFPYETQDPTNPSGRVEVRIPAYLIERFYTHAPVRFENLRAVKAVLDTPERIFSGIREFNQGGWCYVGRPDTWYERDNVVTPFPHTLVFAVYLNPRMHVYECRAEYAAHDDVLAPRGWKERYGGLAWKNTS